MHKLLSAYISDRNNHLGNNEHCLYNFAASYKKLYTEDRQLKPHFAKQSIQFVDCLLTIIFFMLMTTRELCLNIDNKRALSK